MEKTTNFLTTADQVAVNRDDHAYINAKGAKLYGEQTYSEAVEYYHLAAAMGNVDAISNLGYCYLYGRDIPQETSLAIAYFKLASSKGNSDPAYKLGNIYSGDKWSLKDSELSLYYYKLAASYILGDCWQSFRDISFVDELQRFPSLCFALAREMGKGGALLTDISLSYQYLQHAKLGYETGLENGNEMYRQACEAVLEFMQDPQYDKVKEQFEEGGEE